MIRPGTWSLLVVLTLIQAGVLTAQETPPTRRPDSPPRSGRILGTVVDAETEAPLVGATVTLEPHPMGLFPGGEGSSILERARIADTGADGRYMFEEVPLGAYRLRVTRVGYRSTGLRIDYRTPTTTTLSVALLVDPVELEPVEVEAAATSTALAPARGAVVEGRRLLLEEARQDRYPSSDLHILGGGDLLEAVTVGESDILQALHRLPGVLGEDDWSAEPWTRGSRWDETRIYFDGLPLFDPVHLGGPLTGLAPDAVGLVSFNPGVRPADAGDGSAGVLEMSSRPAFGPEHLSLTAELSLLSGRVSARRPLGPASGISLSGRRTYLDWATDEPVDPTAHDLPYSFQDLSGRWDQRLSQSLSLEVSGLWSRDRVRGDIPHTIKGTRGHWGNRAFRWTVEGRFWDLRTRYTEGESTYDVRLTPVPFDPDRANLRDATVVPATRNRIHTRVEEVTVEPLRTDGRPSPWRLGARWQRSGTGYDGPVATAFPEAVGDGRLTYSLSTVRRVLWGRRRWTTDGAIDVAAGLRLESEKSDLPGAESTVRLAPRLATAWSPDPETRFSLAAGRHYQQHQALGLSGFDIGFRITPTHLWIRSAGEIPSIRSDIYTVGGERWLRPGMLLTGTAYLRLSEGHVVADPREHLVRATPAVEPGNVLGPGWTSARGRAAGLDLSLRRLAGRWTGSLSYSLTRARLSAEGMDFPAPGDRTRALDATVRIRALDWLHVGAAFTGASGAPFTRFFAFRCPGVPGCPEEQEPDRPPVLGIAGPALQGRAPAYASLDLMGEWRADVFGVELGGFLQIRNVLQRANDNVYVGSHLECGSDATLPGCTVVDEFENGLPLLPLLGFWLRL